MLPPGPNRNGSDVQVTCRLACIYGTSVKFSGLPSNILIYKGEYFLLLKDKKYLQTQRVFPKGNDDLSFP